MRIAPSFIKKGIVPTKKSLMEFVDQLHNTYQNFSQAFNGRISYGDGTNNENIDGSWASVTTPAPAGTSFTVTHGLQRIPVGVHVTQKNAFCDVLIVSSTKTQITLQASAAGAVIKLFIFLFFFLLLPSYSFGQGANHTNQAFKTVTVSGSTGIGGGQIIQPIAGATITVCNGSTLPGIGATCTGLASIFSNITLTNAISNPTNADNNGNYSFYASAGTNYVISVSGVGLTTYSYVWTAPLVTGSGATLSGNNTFTGNNIYSGTQTFTGPKTTTTFSNPALINSVIVDSSPNSTDTRAQGSNVVLPYYRSDILASGSGVPGNLYTFLRSISTTANPLQDTSNIVANVNTVTLMGQSTHSGAWVNNPVIVLDQIYTWAGTTSYTFGLPVIPTVLNGHFYRQTAGVFGDFGCTSSGSQPTFPTGAGQSVNDGTCTWTESGTYPLTICNTTLGNSCDAEMFGVEVNTFNMRGDPAPAGLSTRNNLQTRLKSAFTATDNGLFPIHVDYLSTYTASTNRPYIGYWVQDAKSSGVQIGDPNCIGCPLVMIDGVRMSERSVGTSGNNYGSVPISFYDNSWNGASAVEQKFSIYSSPLSGANPVRELKFDYNGTNQGFLDSSGVWYNAGSETVTSSPATVAPSSLGWKECHFSNTNCSGMASATDVHILGSGQWWSWFYGANPAGAGSGTTPDANAGVSIGVNSIAGKEAACPTTAGVGYEQICFSNNHDVEVSQNGGPFVPIAGVFTKVIVTPVTVNANVSTDQNGMAITINAGALNSVSRTLLIQLAGIYSTPAASTTTLTHKLKLCTVSGCGSGTVITLASWTTSALGGVQATNNPYNCIVNSSTQIAGASAAFEAHGNLTIDLAALASAAEAVFADNNTATVGTIDSTAQLFLQHTIAFGTASASNSATDRQMIADTVD